MKDNYKEIAILVERLKAQDKSVFPKLYELTYQRIYFLCFSILRNEEDAKDAVQETYIKVLLNIGSLQNNELFIAWANKIVYNICMRKMSKHRDNVADDEFWDKIADDDAHDNTSGTIEALEQAELLSGFINRLAPVLRSTIILKYFDDLKIQQIADIMECPEGTVKSRLNTGKRLLKAAIQSERKSDVFFSAFAFFPIRKALMLSASRSLMAPEYAGIAFENVIAQQGLSSSLSFTPRPAAKPFIHTYAPAAAVSSAVASTSAVAISVVMVLAPPTISNVEVHQPNEGYTNQAVSVTATIDAPLKSIREVYLSILLK